MNVKKLLAISLALLLLLGALAGCSAKTANDAAGYYPPEGYLDKGDGMYGDMSAETADSSVGESAVLSERKLIKTVDLDAETEDLDTLLEQLSQQISALGGYVESQQLYNGSAYSSRRSRNASLTIRIPADKLDEFIHHVSGSTNIISQQADIDDVTLTYVATESRVNALTTEEARLLELMEKAETMSDLLEIEARLTDVRYELESVASQLKVLENQVSYSTVNLYVSEVQQYTPVEEETFWQRVSEGFMYSLKNLGSGIVDLTVFLLSNLPYLAVLAAAAAITLVVIKLATRKKKKDPAQKPSGESPAE